MLTNTVTRVNPQFARRAIACDIRARVGIG
jgi:hypothetical protein